MCMKGKFVHLTFGIVIAILFSLVPVYPLWAEGREFTAAGESLYHELQLVSMYAYFEYARYAQTAWSEATKVVYVVLAIVNLLILYFLVRLALKALRKLISR